MGANTFKITFLYAYLMDIIYVIFGIWLFIKIFHSIKYGVRIETKKPFYYATLLACIFIYVYPHMALKAIWISLLMALYLSVKPKNWPEEEDKGTPEMDCFGSYEEGHEECIDCDEVELCNETTKNI